jgi:hypothetical protein
VDFRVRPSEEAGKCVSNVRLDGPLLRGPHIPSASKLKPNDGTNVGTQPIQIRFQAERVGEQEALPVGIGRILTDLPTCLPQDRTK